MRLQILSLAIFLAAASMNAPAATVGVDRDPPGATPVTGTNFAFGADNNGGGDFAYINESGQAWKELDVFTTLPVFSPTPTCFAGPFKTCAIAGSVQGATIAYTISFGTGQFVAIPNGEGFTINLNDQGADPAGSGSWPPGQDFTAKANDIAPEPSAGTLSLLGSLLAGAAWLQRRRS